MALKIDEGCSHDISDQDVAIQVDGLCPLCLKAEIERLRSLCESLADDNERLIRNRVGQMKDR